MENRIVDIGPLLNWAYEEHKHTDGDHRYELELENLMSHLNNIPIINPETLRPVAHWEEIPDSYVSYAGVKGSWCVNATRCTNPDCREPNPCSLKTPFCPMCGARMEDVPYDRD